LIKKILAVVFIVVLVFGWIASVAGIGSVGPFTDDLKLGLDFKGGVYVVMEAETEATGAELADAMEQTQMIIERRVNDMGLSEPVVTIEGENKIRVELPGVDDVEEAVATIGKTAQLQFLLADGTLAVDGSQVKTAAVGQDQWGRPCVNLEFTGEGSKAFEEATRIAASRPNTLDPETGIYGNAILIVLDGKLESAPVVDNVITGGNAQITRPDGFDPEEARQLAITIRSGALPVTLHEIETNVIGPSLGIDSLNMSLIAGVIGIGIILILMLVVYRMMGLVADISLLLYVLIVFWILALFSAVLNLPGIAGLVLSVGMAVDANVIIFARIKEEFQNGKTLRVSVDSGFKRALTTVIDSQITTMIAGVVLYQFGSGPVRGFAMTLMIGIVVSIFTAVVVTQVFLKSIERNKTLTKPALFGVKTPIAFKREFSFIKHRKVFYIVSVAIIVVGLVLGSVGGFNYGIDFTGGTKIQLDMGKEVSVQEIQDCIEEFDLDASIVHAGADNHEVIIKTTVALDTAARAEILDDVYETFGLDDSALMSVEQFGPSVGELLKKNAVKSVLIAAVCILIYIIIRFEWKFGVAAIIALAHDVLILLAFYGIFQIPINNPFIASVLVVVGYSINDTIVVFDRVRENRKLMKKNHMEELLDKSINQTLFRSVMTSVTTVVVMVPLLILGGETVKEFIVPMIIGVVAGAFSSITIASPIYYQLCQLTEKRNKYKGK